jgi:hypothetical protein
MTIIPRLSFRFTVHGSLVIGEHFKCDFSFIRISKIYRSMDA